MKSNDLSEALDLERDLPTTAADVAALERAKMRTSLDLEGYLRFLAQLPPPSVANPAAKLRPRDFPPFELNR